MTDQFKEDMKKHMKFIGCVQDYIKECRDNKVTDTEIIESFKRFLN
mgnify:CR=1 FL=1